MKNKLFCIAQDLKKSASLFTNPDPTLALPSLKNPLPSLEAELRFFESTETSSCIVPCSVSDFSDPILFSVFPLFAKLVFVSEEVKSFFNPGYTSVISANALPPVSSEKAVLSSLLKGSVGDSLRPNSLPIIMNRSLIFSHNVLSILASPYFPIAVTKASFNC